MLTLIFGVWLNISSIAYLHEISKGCYVMYEGYKVYATIRGYSCDEVAEEINQKARGE